MHVHLIIYVTQITLLISGNVTDQMVYKGCITFSLLLNKLMEWLMFSLNYLKDDNWFGLSFIPKLQSFEIVVLQIFLSPYPFDISSSNKYYILQHNMSLSKERDLLNNLKKLLSKTSNSSCGQIGQLAYTKYIEEFVFKRKNS